MTPSREFRQARSRATYEALIQAATEEFSERGFQAVQTPDIAARAGVSTGAFYRYFSDKREVLLELARYHLERAHEEGLREFEERVPQATDQRAAVAAIVDRIFFLRNKHRAIERVFAAMAFSDPDVARLRAEFITLRVKHITPFVDVLVPKSRAPAPAATAHVLQTTVMAMATEDIRVGCKVGDLKHALVEMIYAYLFSPSTSA